MSQLTFAIRMIIGISIISSRQRRSFHEIKSDEEAITHSRRMNTEISMIASGKTRKFHLI